MLLKIYIIASTLALSFLAVSWGNKNITNLFLKWLFVLLAVFGGFCILYEFGYIIKAN